MPGQVSVMPGLMLHRYGQIDTHRAEALSPPLQGGRIDASQVAAIGHSFGGAA